VRACAAASCYLAVREETSEARYFWHPATVYGSRLPEAEQGPLNRRSQIATYTRATATRRSECRRKRISLIEGCPQPHSTPASRGDPRGRQVLPRWEALAGRPVIRLGRPNLSADKPVRVVVPWCAAEIPAEVGRRSRDSLFGRRPTDLSQWEGRRLSVPNPGGCVVFFEDDGPTRCKRWVRHRRCFPPPEASKHCWGENKLYWTTFCAPLEAGLQLGRPTWWFTRGPNTFAGGQGRVTRSWGLFLGRPRKYLDGPVAESDCATPGRG